MNNRRVILTRPAYTREPVTRKNMSNSEPTSHMHTHAHEHTHAHVQRRATTTTNVVSVVASGASVRVRKDEKEDTSRTYASEDELLDQLLALPEATRKRLMDRAALAKLTTKAGAGEERDITMWSEAVYHAYCQAVGGSGAAGVGPLAFRKLLAATVPWEHISSFMQASKLLSLEVVDRQAVYFMIAELLVKHARGVARHTGIPFAAKLVANCCNNVAGLVDNAFPGYAEAGMLVLVARQMRQVKMT